MNGWWLRAVFAALLCLGTAAHAQTESSANEGRNWTKGYSLPLKVTEGLSVRIPLQYMRFVGAQAHKSSVTSQPAQPRESLPVEFDFFLPDFTGYTPENIEDYFNENKVEVYLFEPNPNESEPDAPGEYAPNVLKRLLKYHVLKPDAYEDLYGLRCYAASSSSGKLTCFGKPDQSVQEIVLDVSVPPFAPGIKFPTMQAGYFSKRFGGVRIAWRTHAKNLPQWQAIDAQIWKFIDAWEIPGLKAEP